MTQALSPNTQVAGNLLGNTTTGNSVIVHQTNGFICKIGQIFGARHNKGEESRERVREACYKRVMPISYLYSRTYCFIEESILVGVRAFLAIWNVAGANAICSISSNLFTFWTTHTWMQQSQFWTFSTGNFQYNSPLICNTFDLCKNGLTNLNGNVEAKVVSFLRNCWRAVTTIPRIQQDDMSIFPAQFIELSICHAVSFLHVQSSMDPAKDSN